MTASTGTYNLAINQGATYAPTFTWYAGQCTCAGTVGATSEPVDITGYTALLQIRTYAGGALLFDASSDLTLGGVAGTIALNIPASVTEGFTWSTGVYDLLLTSSQGAATRLLQGNVTVAAAVST